MKQLEKIVDEEQQGNHSPTRKELKLRAKEVSMFFNGKIESDEITPYKNAPPIDKQREEYADKIFKKYLK